MAVNQRKRTAFRFPLQKYEDEKALYTNFRYLQEYLRGLGEKTAATLIVKTRDSNATAGADFLGNGSSDDEAIQAAIDHLPADGGTIYLAEGNYDITATIDLPAKKIVFKGSGTLDFKGATTAFDSGFSATAGGVYVFEGLTFTGAVRNSSQTTRGAHLFAGASGEVTYISLGCEYTSLSAKSIWGGSSATSDSDFIVVGNTFDDIELRRGVNASDTVAIAGETESGTMVSNGVFANNYIDTITVDNGGGNSPSSYIVGSENGNNNILAIGNVAINIPALTDNFSSDVYASHNVINAVMLGGDHAGTDHGSLDGLTDDDHTQYVLETLADAKGDLWVASAADAAARLAVGSDGEFLTADAAEATGLKWSTAASSVIIQDDDVGTDTATTLDFGNGLTATVAASEAEISVNEGEIDHGQLAGLTDDDHTNLLNLARHTDEHGFIRMEFLDVNEQALTSDVLETVEFDTISQQDDPNGDFTGNTTTGVITINNAGLYIITSAIPLRGTNVSRRFLRFWHNNSVILASCEGVHSIDGARFVQGTTIAKLSATDTVEVQVLMSATNPAVADSDGTTFIILRIG